MDYGHEDGNFQATIDGQFQVMYLYSLSENLYVYPSQLSKFIPEITKVTF